MRRMSVDEFNYTPDAVFGIGDRQQFALFGFVFYVGTGGEITMCRNNFIDVRLGGI